MALIGVRRALIRSKGSSSAFSITNTDNKTDAVGGVTIAYTVGGASSGAAPNIGTPNPKRIVVVGIAARVGATPGVTGVSINGSAATQVPGAAINNAGGSSVDFWYLAVPTGTTATVSVTFASASAVSGISVYRVIPTASTPDAATASFTGAGFTTVSNASPLAVTAGGGFIGIGYAQSASTMGWSAPASVVNDAGTGIALSGGRTFSFCHDIVDTGSVTATVTGSVGSNMDISLVAWH